MCLNAPLAGLVTITVPGYSIANASGKTLVGLDATEHGLPSAYAGFAMLPDTTYVDDGEWEPMAIPPLPKPFLSARLLSARSLTPPKRFFTPVI